MSTFKVSYFSVTDKTQAYDLSKAQITPEALKAVKVKADINYDDFNHRINASGKGFSLSLSFEDDHVACDLELGFLLKALKGKITSELEGRLKKIV